MQCGVLRAHLLLSLPSGSRMVRQGSLGLRAELVVIRRHREERSDEAIQRVRVSALDCFASLAMTACVGPGLLRFARNDCVCRPWIALLLSQRRGSMSYLAST